MKTVKISDGDYAAKYSLTDFYEESAEKLSAVLASGEDFCTHYECKKEPYDATIERKNGKISISVTGYMDNLYESDDLIFDALWDRVGTGRNIPDDLVSAIEDVAWLNGVSDHVEMCAEIDDVRTINELCAVLDDMQTEVSARIDSHYSLLCDIVEEEYNEYFQINS